MKITLQQSDKVELLKALKNGVLDTDLIPELAKVLKLHAPARILTKKEAQELLENLEQIY